MTNPKHNNIIGYSNQSLANEAISLIRSRGIDPIVQEWEGTFSGQMIQVWVTHQLSLSEKADSAGEKSWSQSINIPIKAKSELESCEIEHMIGLYGDVCREGAVLELKVRLLANKQSAPEIQKLAVKSKWFDVEGAVINCASSRNAITDNESKTLERARHLRNALFHGDFQKGITLLEESGVSIEKGNVQKQGPNRPHIDCLEHFLVFVCGGGLQPSYDLFFNAKNIINRLLREVH